jgi:hypothetical protein
MRWCFGVNIYTCLQEYAFLCIFSLNMYCWDHLLRVTQMLIQQTFTEHRICVGLDLGLKSQRLIQSWPSGIAQPHVQPCTRHAKETPRGLWTFSSQVRKPGAGEACWKVIAEQGCEQLPSVYPDGGRKNEEYSMSMKACRWEGTHCAVEWMMDTWEGQRSSATSVAVELSMTVTMDTEYSLWQAFTTLLN